MGFLSSLFAPRNSLILSFSHDDSFEEIESALKEAMSYYRLARVSDLYIGKKFQGGLACPLFDSARVGVVKTVIPRLIAEAYPFSLGIHAHCIGTNRLP